MTLFPAIRFYLILLALAAVLQDTINKQLLNAQLARLLVPAVQLQALTPAQLAFQIHIS